MMSDLSLPKYDFNLKSIEGIIHIFDVIRKKYVKLTPEEWVRQNMVHHLIHDKQFSPSWITVEQGLTYNTMNKRADIICYDRNGKAVLLVECKASYVKINQNVFEQIARYNFELKVPYLLVTNGLKHYCCQMNYNNNSFAFLEDIPSFSTIESLD